MNKKIAIFFHVYHTDMCECFFKTLSLYNIDADIYVNIVQDNFDIEIFKSLKDRGVNILISENRGLDVFGSYSLIKNVMNKYQVIGLVHTKKSNYLKLHSAESSWRDDLWHNVFNNLENNSDFIINKNYGMLGAKQFKYKHIHGHNIEEYYKLCEKCGIPTKNRGKFFVGGNMFCIKPIILQKLANVLHPNDFELDYKNDGRIEHAIERIIPSIIESEKLKVLWN